MYIDAKRIGNRVYVSDKRDGERRVRSFLADRSFYYEDPEGKYKAIDGNRVSKFDAKPKSNFKSAIEHYKREGKVYESDIDPVFKLLEERYPDDEGPQLNVQFLDIETDKDPKRGFATIDNPYAPIIGITIFNSWEEQPITLTVPPENLTMEEARRLLDEKIYQDKSGEIAKGKPEGDDFGAMSEADGYVLVENEEELLRFALEFIGEADVLTGWNSKFYDIPYMMQRIRIVLGGEEIEDLAKELTSERFPYDPSDASRKYMEKMNLFPCLPTLRRVEHYDSYERVYSLHGRIHLDYLELYRKFIQEELHSYTLDFILQHEVKQTKVAYEGSLDQLYRNDLRRFVAYNRQDVMGLWEIDKKRKFIELANSMAHVAGVTLDKVTGSIVIIEQAILKELHKKKLVCFDKKDHHIEFPIPGAYVLDPSKGKYQWIASYDYNSLYPTLIRALNISPETIVGFLKPDETLKEVERLMDEEDMMASEAWGEFIGTLEYKKVLNGEDGEVAFADEATGEEVLIPAKELKIAIKEGNLGLTAFGLMISNEKQGIIPYCIEKWYKQRQKYQRKKNKAIKDSKALPEGEEKKKLEDEAEYYDRLQLVQKLFLNSTYGALLNQYCRFFDSRQGASITMSGRVCLHEMFNVAEHALENDAL